MGWIYNIGGAEGCENAYPVQLAEYAHQKQILKEPAFIWWVSHALKRIISKTKSKYWTRTHKFGVRIPHSVDEALELDIKMRTRCGMMLEVRKSEMFVLV